MGFQGDAQQSDSGSMVGSYRLSPIPEPISLASDPLVTLNKPEDHLPVDGKTSAIIHGTLLSPPFLVTYQFFFQPDATTKIIIIMNVIYFVFFFFGLDFVLSSEFAPIFDSIRKCLELRDKYTLVSGQRLGFNPKDHDGSFMGLPDETSDVTGVRPDAYQPLSDSIESQHAPWRIYPRPPPPHWHWTDHNGAGPSHANTPGEEEFVFEECEIPGEDSWGFEIDEKGVYQIYRDVNGKRSLLVFFFKCILIMEVQNPWMGVPRPQ